VRIGLTYDLRDDYLAAGFSEEQAAEFDRPETIDGIAQALRELGHEPVRIGNVAALAAALVAGERWDLVFNIAEGLYGFGREAQVPALLDAWRLPYTFSDPLVMCTCLHKATAKRLVRDAGIATPDFALVSESADVGHVDLPYPVFAKPVAEGTSKGINGASRVNDAEALGPVCRDLLSRFGQPVLVEGYLAGREFTVGITGSGRNAQVLGVMEVTLHGAAERGVYSYSNKEHYEDRVGYALVTDAAGESAASVALNAWRVLGCRDAGRVDVRMDEAGRANFLEVNPLAGLNPVRSDLAIMCRLLGTEYRALIRTIVESASTRAGARDLAAA